MRSLIVMGVCVMGSLFGRESLDLLIEKERIQERIHEVAVKLNEKYAGQTLSIVLIMKGALCLAADLIQELTIPCTVDYVKASSYGKNGMQRGELKVEFCDSLALEGKNVLLIDDIFDTGHTLLSVKNTLLTKGPRQLETLVLLVKEVPHVPDFLPDYTLFTIPNRFVIGYGLDYQEFYRGLPGIYAFPHDTPPSNL